MASGRVPKITRMRINITGSLAGLPLRAGQQLIAY